MPPKIPLRRARVCPLLQESLRPVDPRLFSKRAPYLLTSASHSAAPVCPSESRRNGSTHNITMFKPNPSPSHVLSTCLLAALAVGCASQPAPAPSDPDVNLLGFDDLPPGALNTWRLGTTNQHATEGHAEWQVMADADARSAPNVVALTDAKGHRGQTFNLLWDANTSLADVDLTVAVRADAGVEDQGGGPAWRIAGPYDYYLARWNPLEDNFRVYAVQGGERIQLDTAKVRVDPEAWHTIRIRHVGDQITCWFNGEELLNATDTTLSGAGGLGLWTKADAEASFDDFAFKGLDD